MRAQRPQAGGDQPEAEQQHARDHRDRRPAASIHLSWLSVVSVSCSGTPRISVRVGRRHRLGEQAEARAAARRADGRAPRLAVAGRAEAAAGCAACGALSPGRVSVAWTTGAPSPGADLDVHSRREHAELRQAVDAPQRAARGPAAAIELVERARDAVRARVERAVDALEERRAQRRVGRDVGDQQTGRGEHREHDEQAGAQRHPPHAPLRCARRCGRAGVTSDPVRAARSRPAERCGSAAARRGRACGAGS